MKVAAELMGREKHSAIDAMFHVFNVPFFLICNFVGIFMTSVISLVKMDWSKSGETSPYCKMRIIFYYVSVFVCCFFLFFKVQVFFNHLYYLWVGVCML